MKELLRPSIGSRKIDIYMHNIDSIEELKERALQARKHLLTIASERGALHIGSSLSQIEILTVLYGSVLRVSPETANILERDRFILSKGHAALGYYVVLAQHGFIPMDEVREYGKDGTKLAAHPVLGSALGIEASTGSLGHGLPMAVGMAMGALKSGWDSRYYVLLSDGECDEGSNWEAILLAGHLKLSNLTTIIDYNKIQSFGRTKEVIDLEPFADKWRAANWDVIETDGHSIEELRRVLREPASGKPRAIIAHTVKGKGISFMEDTLEWHYLNLKPEDLQTALEELI
jgi:transketolase